MLPSLPVTLARLLIASPAPDRHVSLCCPFASCSAMRFTALDSRRTCLLALCILGPALAWMGVLDKLSEQSLDSALLATGAAYASARGINALVSVMQGTEVHAVMLTVAAGEVLDPINDLIERISTLFLFALGSLALQKILLLLVAERLFNVLLTAGAIISACALLRPHGLLRAAV